MPITGHCYTRLAADCQVCPLLVLLRTLRFVLPDAAPTPTTTLPRTFTAFAICRHCGFARVPVSPGSAPPAGLVPAPCLHHACTQQPFYYIPVPFYIVLVNVLDPSTARMPRAVTLVWVIAVFRVPFWILYRHYSCCTKKRLYALVWCILLRLDYCSACSCVAFMLCSLCVVTCLLPVIRSTLFLVALYLQALLRQLHHFACDYNDAGDHRPLRLRCLTGRSCSPDTFYTPLGSLGSPEERFFVALDVRVLHYARRPTQRR